MQKPSRDLAPAAGRPPEDGLVEGEIAAFDGFKQGRTLVAARFKAGEGSARGAQ
ncbi:MAG: hypothetical protein ACREDV_00630 [Methylocella sp.]